MFIGGMFFKTYSIMPSYEKEAPFDYKAQEVLLLGFQ